MNTIYKSLFGHKVYKHYEHYEYKIFISSY